jgi:hypothetical protein
MPTKKPLSSVDPTDSIPDAPDPPSHPQIRLITEHPRWTDTELAAVSQLRQRVPGLYPRRVTVYEDPGATYLGVCFTPLHPTADQAAHLQTFETKEASFGVAHRGEFATGWTLLVPHGIQVLCSPAPQVPLLFTPTVFGPGTHHVYLSFLCLSPNYTIHQGDLVVRLAPVLGAA